MAGSRSQSLRYYQSLGRDQAAPLRRCTARVVSRLQLHTIQVTCIVHGRTECISFSAEGSHKALQAPHSFSAKGRVRPFSRAPKRDTALYSTGMR